VATARRFVSLALASAAFAQVGCAWIGPISIRSARTAYNDAIVATNSEQLLGMTAEKLLANAARLMLAFGFPQSEPLSSPVEGGGDLVAALDFNALAVVTLPLLGALWWTDKRAGQRTTARALPAWVIWAYLVLVIAFWTLRNLPVAPFACLAP